MQEHWKDSRLDAQKVDYTHSATLSAKTQLVVTTNGNITAFSASPFIDMHNATILVDGQVVQEPAGLTQPIIKSLFVLSTGGAW